MPVEGMTPPVVASPKAWVSRSKVPHVAPPSARAVPLTRSMWMALHGGEVDHQATVADGLAGHRVTAALDGEG